jgi:hypothetical protein
LQTIKSKWRCATIERYQKTLMSIQVIAWHCFLWNIQFTRIGTIFAFKAVS